MKLRRITELCVVIGQASDSPTIFLYFFNPPPRSLNIDMSMYVCMYVCMVITYSKINYQPGKVASPARGQLKREFFFSLSPTAPEHLVSRDGFDSPILRQPAHVRTQAESGAYLRDSSRVPRRRPFIF